MSKIKDAERTRKETLLEFMRQRYPQTFPQKINMAFQYLDSDGNGAFGVNDLALADDFLFSNLGKFVNMSCIEGATASICTYISMRVINTHDLHMHVRLILAREC